MDTLTKKTSTKDETTGLVIYHYTSDIFRIEIRKGGNKRSTARECLRSSELPDTLKYFHNLSLPLGYRKYLVRLDIAGHKEDIYSFKGYAEKSTQLIASLSPRKKSKNHPADMKRCNIILHTLPDRLLEDINNYNYQGHLFPTKNSRQYLLKIMVGYFFSLKEEDKIAFTKKCRERYEEYSQGVINDTMELL